MRKRNPEKEVALRISYEKFMRRLISSQLLKVIKPEAAMLLYIMYGNEVWVES